MADLRKKTNYRQLYAIKKDLEHRLLKLNPNLDHGSGIYFFIRKSEQNENEIYVGQSNDILRRCVDHLTQFMYVDLSIRAHGLYSEENPHGYRLEFLHFPLDKLDEKEKYYIKIYREKGWILKNKTGGGQGEGKEKIGEFRPQKGYRDGLKQGYKNASRDVSVLFDKHLDYKPKSEVPTHHQLKAMEKFKEFLEHYNGNEVE